MIRDDWCIVYAGKLPIQICDKELFRTIIESAVSGTYDEEQANKRKLRAAYNKFVDSCNYDWGLKVEWRTLLNKIY